MTNTEINATRYEYLRQGKPLVIKCGNITIHTGANPDYINQYPKALDNAVDLAIKNENIRTDTN